MAFWINNGATFVKVDRIYSKRDNSSALLFLGTVFDVFHFQIDGYNISLDDGGGKDPEGIWKCMSLGYSTKKTNSTIGQCNYREVFSFNIFREEIEKKDDDHDHLQVSKRQQRWTKQITIRGVVISIILRSIYTVIAMKLNLTTGMTPNLNVSAALLGFMYMKTWTKILQKYGISTVPFTKH
ncbi:Oligopeptide transporter OPT superfamily [Cynara cardunculus var. scolymus]|uniref:Oligopeptide transporter OPT superfamily n=1 Tax=Cynara cardunculus var. scolymus TaxID=59895 RepID=A0A124R3E8_CYNCS|nr:Oligopeptide transporter OPT superfamily [Cynara cardunculus var. scolymus]